MPIDCSPSATANAARCFDSCIPPGMQAAVQTYLLEQFWELSGGTPMTPQELLTAAQRAGYSKIPPGMQQQVQNWLLCQLGILVGA